MVQIAANSIAQPFYLVDGASVTPGAPVTSPTAPPTALAASAQDATGVVKPPILTFLGHQLGLAIDSSTGLTVPVGTRYAVIQVRAQIARYRYDGATTAPTASVGMTLPIGSELAVDLGQTGIAAMRFISQTAGSLLDVAYFS